VNQVQIQVVQLQPLHRALEGRFGAFEAGVLDPQLGGDKQIFAGHAAAFDRVADGHFVAIRRRGVNQPIARADSVDDASFALLGIRNLKHAEPQKRHFHAVVQGYYWDSHCHTPVRKPDELA